MSSAGGGAAVPGAVVPVPVAGGGGAAAQTPFTYLEKRLSDIGFSKGDMKNLRRADIRKDATTVKRGDSGPISSEVIEQICEIIIGSGAMPMGNFLHRIEHTWLGVERPGTQFLNSINKAAIQVAILDVGDTTRYVTPQHVLICPASWTDPGSRPDIEPSNMFFPDIGLSAELTTAGLFGFDCITQFTCAISRDGRTFSVDAKYSKNELNESDPPSWKSMTWDDRKNHNKLPYCGNPCIHEAVNRFNTDDRGRLSNPVELAQACKLILAKNGLHGDPGLPAWLLEYAYAKGVNLVDTCVVTSDLVEAVTTVMVGEGLVLRQKRSVMGFAAEMNIALSETFTSVPAVKIVKAILEYVNSGEKRIIPPGPEGEVIEDLLERAMFVPGTTNLNLAEAYKKQEEALVASIKYKEAELNKTIDDEALSVLANNDEVVESLIEFVKNPDTLITVKPQGRNFVKIKSKHVPDVFKTMSMGWPEELRKQLQAEVTKEQERLKELLIDKMKKAEDNIARLNILQVFAGENILPFRKFCEVRTFQRFMNATRTAILSGFTGLLKVSNDLKITDNLRGIILSGGGGSFVSWCIDELNIPTGADSRRTRRNRHLRKSYQRMVQRGGHRREVIRLVSKIYSFGRLLDGIDTFENGECYNLYVEGFAEFAYPYVKVNAIEDGEGELVLALLLLLPNYHEINNNTVKGQDISLEKFIQLYTRAEQAIWGSTYDTSWILKWIDEEYVKQQERDAEAAAGAGAVYPLAAAPSGGAGGAVEAMVADAAPLAAAAPSGGAGGVVGAMVPEAEAAAGPETDAKIAQILSLPREPLEKQYKEAKDAFDALSAKHSRGEPVSDAELQPVVEELIRAQSELGIWVTFNRNTLEVGAKGGAFGGADDSTFSAASTQQGVLSLGAGVGGGGAVYSFPLSYPAEGIPMYAENSFDASAALFAGASAIASPAAPFRRHPASPASASASAAPVEFILPNPGFNSAAIRSIELNPSAEAGGSSSSVPAKPIQYMVAQGGRLNPIFTMIRSVFPAMNFTTPAIADALAVEKSALSRLSQGGSRGSPSSTARRTASPAASSATATPTGTGRKAILHPMTGVYESSEEEGLPPGGGTSAVAAPSSSSARGGAGGGLATRFANAAGGGGSGGAASAAVPASASAVGVMEVAEGEGGGASAAAAAAPSSSSASAGGGANRGMNLGESPGVESLRTFARTVSECKVRAIKAIANNDAGSAHSAMEGAAAVAKTANEAANESDELQKQLLYDLLADVFELKDLVTKKFPTGDVSRRRKNHSTRRIRRNRRNRNNRSRKH